MPECLSARRRCGLSLSVLAFGVAVGTTLIGAPVHAQATTGSAPGSAPASTVNAPSTSAPDAAPTTAVHQSRTSRVVGGVVFDLLMFTGGSAADDARVADAAFLEIERVLTELGPAGAFASLNTRTDAVTLSPEAFALLREAHRVATVSQGAFDPTAETFFPLYAPVFDEPRADAEDLTPVDDDEPRAPATSTPEASPAGALPTSAALEAAAASVGVNRLRLDVAARSARRTGENTLVGLQGTELGYAMDRARGALLESGVESFILSADGDVVVHGVRDGRRWMVGVQDPRGSGPFLVLPLDVETLGGAVMTASDNEDVRFVDGARVHRHLNPATGAPATSARSVTVIADDAFTAECLARAAFVLGPREGLKLIARQPGANAVFVDDKNQVHLTPGLKKLARAGALTWRPPTDE